MQVNEEELLAKAFDKHMERQPKPRPSSHQTYWFGLGVRSVQPYVEKLEREVEKLRGEK